MKTLDMKRFGMLFGAMVLAASVLPLQPGAAERDADRAAAIVTTGEASALETFAAREVQRYAYLRTGRLLPIVERSDALRRVAQAIVVTHADRPIARRLAQIAGDTDSIAALKAGEYRLLTIANDDRRVVLITGGDDIGTLYGAYQFAEALGVRFYLHGDVIPDAQIDFALPGLDVTGKPLFELRGIQPFHDFPEGPDWWNLDEYKAILSQLPKLRMNFFGLHTYPEGGPNAEPTVWIGLPRDIGEDGRVEFSYPASYQNTLRGNWGYAARKTSEFFHGSAMFFDRDLYGPDVMMGHLPQPDAPEDCNAVFNATGDLLRGAFEHAHALGIKTCVGTETPMTVPRRVRDRLADLDMASTDPAVVQRLYEGIFQRAAEAYPLDYYWFWTPESWTWRGAGDSQVEATVADMKRAIAAAEAVDAPFTLATCGWVLGPQGDRAMWDRVLPPDMPLSCINRQVGKDPVDPSFANVKRHNKWAIPWMEDDPALTSVQLWAGRMRRDAADALRYGCNGLFGIHWRTRVLGPNVLALARAAWDQEGFEVPADPAMGPVGGNVAAFNNPISGTDDDPLYQTVRYDMAAYRFAVPDGEYKVTLKFCEPNYREAGKRVFGVKIEGRTVIDRLDIFETAGADKALDRTFDNVKVEDGRLDIDFVKQVEFPSIAAILVEGEGKTISINCGGGEYEDYIADPSPPPRHLAAGDFYRDWARHQFGAEAADEIAGIFSALDGNTPRSSEWVSGPGGLLPDKRPWAEAQKDYLFIGELAALHSRIEGAGNRERFDYWLNNFRYMRAASHLRCLWAEYQDAEQRMEKEKDPVAKKKLARETVLPIRLRMIEVIDQVFEYLLPTISNTGELGTVANWNQHILDQLLTQPGAKLEAALGEPLLAEAFPSREYDGPPHLFVLTARTSIGVGEDLNLRAICLAKELPEDAALFWSAMGLGEFACIPLRHIARGVYEVTIPGESIEAPAIEYYIEAKEGDDETLLWPAGAPVLNQTVVVMGAGE